MPTVRPIALALALAVLATSCTGWRRVDVPTPPATLTVHRKPMRVTLVNRDVFEFRNVVIVTDSLFGTTIDEIDPVRMGIALRNVTRLEEQVKDPRRTALAIAAGTAFILLSGIAGFSLK
ncbi:MAG TPA: hypothetical protein VF178_12320 [Gemmatimonadaceae bacterium]